MKKLISILFTLLITTASAGDLDKIYSSASEQISHKLSQLVPGDGITEVSLEIKGDGSDALRSDIKAAVNQTLIAEDAGLTIESDASQGMIAVARTSGLGLLEILGSATMVVTRFCVCGWRSRHCWLSLEYDSSTE